MHPHLAADVGQHLVPVVDSTLKKAFGSDSTTVPSISIAPSFLGISSALRCSCRPACCLGLAGSCCGALFAWSWAWPSLAMPGQDLAVILRLAPARLAPARSFRIRATRQSSPSHCGLLRHAAKAVHGPQQSLRDSRRQSEPGAASSCVIPITAREPRIFRGTPARAPPFCHPWGAPGSWWPRPPPGWLPVIQRPSRMAPSGPAAPQRPDVPGPADGPDHKAGAG